MTLQVTLIMRKRAMRNPLITQYFGHFDPVRYSPIWRVGSIASVRAAAAQSIADAHANGRTDSQNLARLCSKKLCWSEFMGLILCQNWT
jgi:hypothetical protein